MHVIISKVTHIQANKQTEIEFMTLKLAEEEKCQWVKWVKSNKSKRYKKGEKNKHWIGKTK